MLLSGVCALFLLVILAGGSTSSPIAKDAAAIPDNCMYPLTKPSRATKLPLALITDLDSDSKIKIDNKTVWVSYYKKGYLFYEKPQNEINIVWDNNEPIQLTSDEHDNKDRGMELSELVTFNGNILSFDDRTGYIYYITEDIPLKKWIKLKVNDDEDDSTAKGFKTEWATVKDGFLYAGSMGREWRSKEGVVQNRDAMIVKKVSKDGDVISLDWTSNFEKLRLESYNITDNGYMTHESCVWSHRLNKWVFAPRRCSKEDYNEAKDGYRGCNYVIIANEDFSNIETVILEPNRPQPTRGFSSIKLIPNTNIIVAIKTVELDKGTVEIDGKTETVEERKTETFLVAFDIKGKILYEERHVSDLKYEGLEFI